MTTTAPRELEGLGRDELARLGREWMLFGHLYDRALMPQVALRFGMDEIVPLGIAEWMGASPVYTGRMRRLMGIDGDGVTAICKALQLDVGFVHEYMDVGYRITDETHGEFWLNHCGALLDVEPQGAEMVVNMCHHIEDPTFDATAVATNPRARIRPIHRPPRVPADRHPHCHWTLTIDPAADPIVADPLTDRVGALTIAAVPNAVAADRSGGGRPDYSGAFDPEFRLERLSQGALVAVLREFSMQCLLLSASAELHLAGRHELRDVRDVLADQWAGASWVAAERIARCLEIDGGGLDAVLGVLGLHPGVPPCVELAVTRTGDGTATVRVHAADGLLDPEAPGWIGLLARDEPRGIAAVAQAVDPRTSVTVVGPHTFAIDVDPSRVPVQAPESVELTRISTAASWTFRS